MTHATAERRERPSRRSLPCSEESGLTTEDTQPNSPHLKHKQCVPESLAETLASMCGIEIESVDERQVSKTAGGGTIIAIISLVGDIEWLVSVGLARAAAVGIVEKFAGMEVPFESDDMGDAVGELVNVLAGEITARLDQRGVRVQMSLPSVVRGDEMEPVRSSESTVVITHFHSPYGRLWCELTARQKRDKKQWFGNQSARPASGK